MFSSVDFTVVVVVISSFFCEVVVVVDFVVVVVVVVSAVFGEIVGSFVDSSFLSFICGESFFSSISTRSKLTHSNPKIGFNRKYRRDGSFRGLPNKFCPPPVLSAPSSTPAFDVLFAFLVYRFKFFKLFRNFSQIMKFSQFLQLSKYFEIFRK
jgi:hypothetical protein